MKPPAAVVVVDDEAHDVLLDVQRVVVLALPCLDPALAGGVVEGAVTLPAALLAAEVVDLGGRFVSSVSRSWLDTQCIDCIHVPRGWIQGQIVSIVSRGEADTPCIH